MRILLTLLLLSALPLAAQEKKIRRADLPAPVEKTVVAQSQGATIRGFSAEKEKGQTFYEADMTVDGHSKDVLIDKQGKVVEIEEQAAIDALPAPVRDALKAKAEPGELMKVESLTKHGKLVAYEAVVQTNGRRREIQVGPDGQTLNHEE